MSNKFQEIKTKKKTHTYYFFDDIGDTKNCNQNNSENIQKYSDLLHWICDDQQFKIRKT